MTGEIFLKILGNYMSIKAKQDRIISYIECKGIKQSCNLDFIDKKNIKAAVIQEKITILKDYRQYIDYMYGYIKKAVDAGAQIIAFPEYNGMLALGMLPFIEVILKQIAPKNGKNDNKGGRSINLSAALTFLLPYVKTVFETTFSRLSKSFGVYIMAGSIVVEEKGRLFNRSYLFGPDGETVGTQDKMHPMEVEKTLGICQGTDAGVFDTRIGKIAFPVCMDATYFETFKILKKRGAEIVIIPIANMEEYNYYLALRGIWPRVQENPVYGLKAALVGDIFGSKFTGRAGIFGPIKLTKNRSGIIGEAAEPDKEDIICESIDLTLIENFYDPYFSDTNPELYRKYFPEIYNGVKR